MIVFFFAPRRRYAAMSTQISVAFPVLRRFDCEDGSVSSSGETELDLIRSDHDRLQRWADEWDSPGLGLPRWGELAPVAYDELEAACRRLTADELEAALKFRYLPVAFAPGPEAYVAAGPAALAAAHAHDKPVVGSADARDLVEALQAVYGEDLCRRAVCHLAQAAPEFSACWRISLGQGVALVVAAATLIAIWHVSPVALAIAASLLFGIVFLAVCGVRLLGLLPAGPLEWPAHLSDEELPVYTVLVPLFRETRVLDQLIEALCRIDYPALGSKRTKP